MYEDWTQNYDSEIHKEYLIHDTPSQPCADYSVYVCMYISSLFYL